MHRPGVDELARLFAGTVRVTELHRRAAERNGAQAVTRSAAGTSAASSSASFTW